METNKPLTPSRAIHPGEILGEELKARGISQKTFAAQIECAPSQLCEVIKGKRKVGDALAFKLEQALGIPYSFWMKMQASYNYDLRVLEAQADKEEQEYSSEVSCAEKGISYLIRLKVYRKIYAQQLLYAKSRD